MAQETIRSTEIFPEELAETLKQEIKGLAYGEIEIVAKVQDGKIVHATSSRKISIRASGK